MTQIEDVIEGLFCGVSGLPAFKRTGAGVVDGWPADVVRLLESVVTTLAHSSREDLGRAILKIEETDPRSVPQGVLALLSRVAWDSPASPDALSVTTARRRGLSLGEALFGDSVCG